MVIALTLVRGSSSLCRRLSIFQQRWRGGQKKNVFGLDEEESARAAAGSTYLRTQNLNYKPRVVHTYLDGNKAKFSRQVI
jgi:hypothetical protein